MNIPVFAIICSTALALSSCGKKHIATGYDFQEDFQPQQLAKISTQSEALEMLGSPTYQVEHDNTHWYYFNIEATRPVAGRPITNKHKIILLSFNNEGKLVEQKYLDDSTAKANIFNNDKTTVAGDNDSIMYRLMGGLAKGSAASSITK